MYYLNYHSESHLTIIYFNLTFYDLFNYYLFNKLTSPLQFLHKPVWETLKLCNV